jgi:hypothetical protein
MILDRIFKKDQWSSLTQNRSNFHDLISAEQELDNCIFLHKDESFGVTYEVDLIEHETLVLDQLGEIHKRLEELIKTDDGITLSFFYTQKFDQIKPHKFEDIDKEKDFPKFLINKRHEYLSSDKIKKFKRNLYLSIRFEKRKEFKAKSLKSDLFFSPQRKYYELIGPHLKKIEEIEKVLRRFESFNELKLNRCDSLQLSNITDELFKVESNSKKDDNVSNWKELLGLKTIAFSPEEQKINNKFIKTGFLAPPKYTFLGSMSYLLNIEEEFSCVLNISKIKQSEVSLGIGTKEMFLNKAYTDKADEILSDLRSTQKRIENDDELKNVSLYFFVTGVDKKEADFKFERIQDKFRDKIGLTLKEEKNASYLMLLSSIPQNYESSMDKIIKRSFPIHRTDVPTLIPIYTSFKGFNGKTQLYISREGSPVDYDFYISPNSQHSVVLADTGVGKSFFMNSIRQGLMTKETPPLIIVLEKKSSNKMACKLFNGRFNELKASKNQFSPLLGVYDEEKVDFLTNYFKSAITMTSPEVKFSGMLSHKLKKSITNAYNRAVLESNIDYIEGEIREISSEVKISVTVDLIIDELSITQSEVEEESDIYLEIEKVKQALEIFLPDGPYGSLFTVENKNESTEDCLFHVYDIDGLESDPVKRDLLVIAIFEEIRQLKKLPQNKNRDIIFEIDEIARFDSIPYAKEMIIEYAEMGRKEGIWLVAITNRAENYIEKDVCKAMWGVADNYYFLAMGADNASLLRNEFSSFINEADHQIIASLEFKMGQYSEIYFKNKKNTKSGAFRYHPTKHELWSTPSNIESTRRLNEKLDSGMPPVLAIETLIEEEDNDEINK